MSKTSEPDVVPDKIKSHFNFKALIGIGLLVISFHITINFFLTDSSEEIASVFSFVTPLLVSIFGFFVAIKYSGAKIFSRAYFALAFGFLAIFGGEITYLVYDLYIPDIDPYPSIADVFFFIQYPMILAHLLINIKFFAPKLNKASKLLIALFPIGVLALFTVLSDVDITDVSSNFDYYYGAIFVYASSLTLSVGVIGAVIFKEGVIGKAWLLLVLGILFNTIGDTWYYNLEIFGDYSLDHMVNLFWYAGYWLVLYALIKHKKLL